MVITEYDCTGCRACEQKCPKHCILMKEDKEGFLMPYIDHSLCIECDVCATVCPLNKEIDGNKPNSVFAVRYKNDAILSQSASGGAFAAIARTVLENGGIVYGAVYHDDLSVSHIAVYTISELYRMQSSKYVQSDTLKTFSEVKTALKGGMMVLYSGTPCQIGGLNAFLGKEYPNLLTVDIICHGVPSPKLFAKYIEWLGIKNKGKILSCNFRDKTGGWGLGYKTKTKTKTKTIDANADPYYSYFLKGHTYRECCYQCKYAKKERISDFTLGDYWGIQKEHPSFYSTKGVSLMMNNTTKAQKWFNKNSELFYIQESSFEKASKHNINLLHPTERNEIRDAIYTQIDQPDVIEYFDTNFPIHISVKEKIKIWLPVNMKLFLKNLYNIIDTHYRFYK
jgi:coenzyme F420-reducing hydrogenase beta subunit